MNYTQNISHGILFGSVPCANQTKSTRKIRWQHMRLINILFDSIACRGSKIPKYPNKIEYINFKCMRVCVCVLLGFWVCERTRMWEQRRHHDVNNQFSLFGFACCKWPIGHLDVPLFFLIWPHLFLIRLQKHYKNHNNGRNWIIGNAIWRVFKA